MDLAERISDEIKQAMHARDSIKLDVLRAVRNEIIKFTKTGSSSKISDDDVLKIVKSQVKQRREAISMFDRGGRPDLVANEEKQMKILESFLPEQLSADELQNIVSAAVVRACASDVKDMGRVMKEVMMSIRQTGKDADNRLVSELVKRQLTT